MNTIKNINFNLHLNNTVIMITISLKEPLQKMGKKNWTCQVNLVILERMDQMSIYKINLPNKNSTAIKRNYYIPHLISSSSIPASSRNTLRSYVSGNESRKRSTTMPVRGRVRNCDVQSEKRKSQGRHVAVSTMRGRSPLRGAGGGGGESGNLIKSEQERGARWY